MKTQFANWKPVGNMCGLYRSRQTELDDKGLAFTCMSTRTPTAEVIVASGGFGV